MSAYNKATVSGFIPAESILAGWLPDKRTPIVSFEVVSGRLPYSVYIVDARLGMEMYAWKLGMNSLGMTRVHVVVEASLVSSGARATLVMQEADYHTSNPDLRLEVERCFSQMLAGRSPVQWPNETIRLPGKTLQP
jgi:hypothetical protein